MPRLSALVALCAATTFAMGCGGASTKPQDAATPHDGGHDTGEKPDGGEPDGGCESDPGCAVPGPRCDPAGTDRLGECVDVGGGCLRLQGLAACPSTRQACPVGEAECQCPADGCTTEVDTACGTDGTVVTCQLDAVGGCGVYPETGGQACSGHQGCQGDAPAAACACDASDCTAAGLRCTADGLGLVTCAVDGTCPYAAATDACAMPKTCQGTFPFAACACPLTGLGTRVDQGCATVGTRACDPDTGDINECVLDNASGCKVWRLAAGTTCSSQQLACGTDGGAPACQCPLNTTGIFYADATNGSPTGGMPYVTGVLAPAQCRFKALTPALARASQWVQTHASAEVRATGQVNISVMHFAEAAYPLVVDHDVTLTTTDNPLDASRYVIDFAPSGSAVVQLGGNAALKGFTLQNLVAAATNADGVVTSSTCAAGTTATLETVRIAGESTPYHLRNGVVVSGAAAGSCDASLTDVEVRGVSQAGLLVQATATAATTRVVDSLFDGGSNGVRALRGTVELDSVVVSNSATQGVMILPTGGDVVFTGVAGAISGSQREGVRVELGTGATSAGLLALTGTEVSANGANTMSTARFPGLAVLARTARLLGVNVHDNAGGGLQASGAGTTVTVDLDAGNAAHFDSNGNGEASAYPGIRVEAGAGLTATGLTANANDGQGVYVLGSGSSLTLHGCQLDGNGVVGNLAGLRVDAGTVVVDGATVISNNRGAGIRELGGTVTLSGTSTVPVVVRDNGQGTVVPGVDVGIGQGDAAFGATFAELRANSGDGARVNNRNAAGVGQPVDFVNCLFVDNKTAGLRVQQSAPGSGSTRSLHVTSSTFQGGERGVIIEPVAGANIWAVFQGNTITKAANVGFILQGTAGSAISLLGNEIVENSGAAPAPGDHATGGLILMGTPPATFLMTGNLVHGNAMDQVAVFGTGLVPPAWDLSAPTCADANRFWCYNGADANSFWVGLRVDGATVTANHESWTHATPASPADYLLTGAGGISVTSACGTGLTCP